MGRFLPVNAPNICAIMMFKEVNHMTQRPTIRQRKSSAIFPTAEKFTRAAEDYFNHCDAQGIVYGEAGLCLALTQGNPKNRAVTLQTLRSWYDGKDCLWLQEAVQLAYLRIQSQIESDPRYQEKSGIIRWARWRCIPLLTRFSVCCYPSHFWEKHLPLD